MDVFDEVFIHVFIIHKPGMCPFPVSIPPPDVSGLHELVESLKPSLREAPFIEARGLAKRTAIWRAQRSSGPRFRQGPKSLKKSLESIEI
jgi:hypothetical protein